jgi:hypothetical protein
MATYSQAVERWRPIVARYFAPQDVDKALWVIQWESGGDPRAMGDGGASGGLFQLNSGGVGSGLNNDQKFDPETNIRTAAAAVYGGQGWKPWGENNTYNGQKFGALGNHPYPGGGQQQMTGWRTAPITQGFGPTDTELDGAYAGAAHFNKGLDFGVPIGTPIDSVVGGTVVAAGDQGDGWGISVKVKDANGYIHNYGHLSGVNVQAGQTIQAGTIVGASGNSGKSTGPHVSYDVLDPNGQYIDPSGFLSAPGSGAGGNVTYPGGGGFGADYDDPAIDADYQQRKQRYLTAYQKWVDAGRPQAWTVDPDTGEIAPNADNPIGFEYASSLMDMQEFTSTFGAPKARNSTDPAQQAFDNAIALGDFDLRRSDAAYRQWYDKLTEARANSEGEIQDAINKNAMNESLASSYRENYGTSPVPSTKTYVPGDYEKVLAKWKGTLGVGDAPPALPPSGITLPGAGGPLAPSVPVAPTPSAAPEPNWGAAGDEAYFQIGAPSATQTQNGPRLSSSVVDTNVPMRPFDDASRLPVNPADNNIGAMPPTRGRFEAYAKQFPVKDSPSTGATKKKNQPWWKKIPGFAEGVQGFEGGPAMLGEKGPEEVEIPGFGTFRVGDSGPEMRNLPAGSNVIPLDQKYLFSQIQQAARASGQADPARKQQEMMARRSDPQVQAKAMEALKAAMAGAWATKPPPTPVLRGEGWTEDPWADRRALTGVPATEAEMMAAQQKGGKPR